MEYKILQADTINIIENEVNSFLQKGWKMLGNINILSVRKSESPGMSYDVIIYTQVIFKD